MAKLIKFIPTHLPEHQIGGEAPVWAPVNPKRENWATDERWMQLVVSVNPVPGVPGIISVTLDEETEFDRFNISIYKGDVEHE